MTTAHGWSGRDLMAHLLAWQEIALRAAKELAVNETSETFAQHERRLGRPRRRGHQRRDRGDLGGRARWRSCATGSRPSPGELRGYLTVVPETRWLKHAKNLESFRDETIEHYEEHADDLRAILDAAGAG